ncbi:MAG: DUF72 domain-containing protein [Deltaproteobacteria bacterium]|nr:MAG: DUF72 domain-containing protein [Deltaproteobacteria bacterium]
MSQVIRIGTSGWTYPHWREIFYPVRCPKKEWLSYYSTVFDTVELNATFYRLPDFRTFRNWHARTPDHFIWAVKASKYITHTRRLREPEEPLERFYGAASGLGEKLGPVLFQLPPGLPFEADVLGKFCRALKAGFRHVLEVRHPSWISEQVFDILRTYGVGLCIADTAGRYPLCEVLTTDFVYIRLHGAHELYRSDYSEDELNMWARKIRAWGKDTYVYFDNDAEGHAVRNAKGLKKILGL